MPKNTKNSPKLIHKIKKHKLSSIKKRVTLIKCWDVIFNADGYAPDETVFHCATKALAETIASIFHDIHHDECRYALVNSAGVKGLIYSPGYVEGYNWACYYQTSPNMARKDEIITSIEAIDTSMIYDKIELPNTPGVYQISSEETEVRE